MDRGLLWWALKSSGGVVVMMVHCSIFNGRQYWDVLAFSIFSFFFSLFDNICVLFVVAKEAYCFYYIPASLHCAHSGRVPIT